MLLNQQHTPGRVVFLSTSLNAEVSAPARSNEGIWSAQSVGDT